MKKIIISALAAVSLATTAYATDVPNKKKAPLPAPVAAAPAKSTGSNDSLSISYGQDFENNFGSKTGDSYGVGYTHNIGGGFTVGGVVSTSQAPNSNLKQNIEGQVGYKLPAFAGIVVGGKVGVGQRFVDTGNFPYYAVYGTADYKLFDGLTLNAIQYRYRSAVDNAAYGYQSHQIGTGVTYDINSTYSVNGKIARNYDTNGNATGDSVTVGLVIKF